MNVRLLGSAPWSKNQVVISSSSMAMLRGISRLLSREGLEYGLTLGRGLGLAHWLVDIPSLLNKKSEGILGFESGCVPGVD